MKYFVGILISILLFSCSNNQEEQTSSDGFQLPDSLFAFQNIENTFFLDDMYWSVDEISKMYVDSTKSKEFIMLDSAQKMRLIAPVTDIDSNYVVGYMDAFFVSKQKMVGEFTPVTIYLYGDDYASLLYIVLDKTLNPVSHYIAYGGEWAGPAEGEDGTIILQPIINSFFKENKFFNYSLTETFNTDSVPHPSIFDSVYYESEILPSGKIQTKKVDSVRFERMSKQ